MSSNARIVVIVVLLLASPVMYVPSSGPAVVLVHKELLDYEEFDTIYWPLNRLYESNETVAEFFNWYDSLWLRLFGIPTTNSSIAADWG